MNLTSSALQSPATDTKRADSPFPSPATGGDAFVARNDDSPTPPPATPTRQFKLQSASSTPDSNCTANSVTGTLEDVLPRMKEELQDRQVLNLPLDAFLKRFITLEDAQCELALPHLFSISSPNLGPPATNFPPIFSVSTPTVFKCPLIRPFSIVARCSSDDDVAIFARDPLNLLENNDLFTQTDLPRKTSEGEIIPWLCRQANSISANCLLSRFLSGSTETLSQTTAVPNLPNVKWFCHGELSLGTDSKNKRKMDFGLSWRDYVSTKIGNDRVHWEDVEVVGEHTDQQYSTEKLVKLAE